MIPFVTPSASKNNQIISATVTLVFTQMKSVPMSISLVNTNIVTHTYIMGSYAETNVQPFVARYFPYVIANLSPSYLPLMLPIDKEIVKKHLSQEQLIGLVCGSTAVFFLILAIIILSIQKRSQQYSADLSDIYYFSDDEDEEIMKRKNEETNADYEASTIDFIEDDISHIFV